MLESSYLNGKDEGTWSRYSESGVLQLESNHKNGKQHGSRKEYYNTGKIKLDTFYEEDLKEGV